MLPFNYFKIIPVMWAIFDSGVQMFLICVSVVFFVWYNDF